MKEKFVKKYMRLAKFIGEDQNPCYSRQIGAVITTADGRRVLGTGYNGPAPGTPHTDSVDYLENFFWPKLTDSDLRSLQYALLRPSDYGNFELLKRNFIQEYKDKKICPRRLVGAESGERSDLCTCGHAERHAVTNAACDLKGTVMFCWCPVPCLQCADTIIQAGISTVHCLQGPEYQHGSRWLFNRGGVTLVEHTISLDLCDSQVQYPV